MDKIFLSSLTIECIVGIWEWERRVKQTVIVDLEMATDIRRAAASDHIEDTIDYKKVAKRLLAFVGESQFNLVETLAENIARVLHETRPARFPATKMSETTNQLLNAADYVGAVR